MKQILSGEKRYVAHRCTSSSVLTLLNKYIKNRQVINFQIPNYPELAVKNVKPLIENSSYLMMYFPDFKTSQLPEKELMYAVLNTLKPNEVRELVTQSFKNRAPKTQDDKDGLVELTRELYESIQDLYSMKSKQLFKA